MPAAPLSWDDASGASRLLEHCSTLTRVTNVERASAQSRLESELGGELTRRLVGALTSRCSRRPLCV
ncbi:MAG: hypothetical protein E6G67_06170 [Actinobacteria bacterium]|nr:MAG: hypothetical protein E6G67_06170 [Actinomycetota bacterium]